MLESARGLYVQSGPTWDKVEIRGHWKDRLFVKMPDAFCDGGDTVELDLAELQSKRCVSHNGHTFFTHDGKDREDAENAKTIAAGQMSEAMYVHVRHSAYFVLGSGESHPPRWESHRVFQQNERWCFFYRGERLTWVERNGLDSHEGASAWDGSDGYWTVYSEAGMRAAMLRDERTISDEDATALGIPINATEADVIAAFKQLAKIHHPDTGGTAEGFRKLSQARDRALATLTARKKAA
jgi:hypothetical protein